MEHFTKLLFKHMLFFSYIELPTFNQETTDDSPSAPPTFYDLPFEPLEPSEPLYHQDPPKPQEHLEPLLPLAHTLPQEPAALPEPLEPLAPTETSLTLSGTLPAGKISKSEILVSLKKTDVTKLETGLISKRSEE